MLQEVSDDRTYCDILTDARNAYLQAADTTDDQLDLYACCTCLVKCLDDISVT